MFKNKNLFLKFSTLNSNKIYKLNKFNNSLNFNNSNFKLKQNFTFIRFFSINESLTLNKSEILKLTNDCAKQINRFKNENPNVLGLRVSVDTGGCFGHMYNYQFTNELEHEDIIFELDGASIIVDPISLKELEGCTIDFVKMDLRKKDVKEDGFRVVSNPNVSSSCSCARSFAVKS
eukprot:TRINITY_DN2685_c2_g1_i1.p1 TRINITY_DN2685_c2_g1~~TRINITY_DN2685_c2_g1_i1.p1  ORF type:complete len:206 (+),score=61.58 TRINITY_DN2685_c2_g1_i1:92-619(+)